MSEKIVQTAGRDQLGEFAPMFAHLNDDVLFGEVWNEEAIDVKTKCIITVVSLMASGITDSSLTYHLQNAKAHGVTKEEIAAIITHATMYVGWPKGWAVFRLAKEVWDEEYTGADTYEIKAAKEYTDADLDWNDSDSRTTHEQNDASVRPEIGSDPVSLEGYKTIYIGYPIWWGEEPRIMDTFVESYDFDGITMIPFCTSSSSDIGRSGKTSRIMPEAATGSKETDSKAAFRR